MIPAALEEAIRQRLGELEAAIPGHRAGRMTADELRPIRLALCLHQQADPERYMLRVRVPAGQATADDLDALAVLARGGAAPRLVHLTTRQCFQIHDLTLDEAPGAIRHLLDHGLATAGTCGNALRNVAACEGTGICGAEVADAAALAHAVSDALSLHPGHPMPRKFKMSASGCAHDCSRAIMQDAGWVGRDAGGPDGPTFDLWGGGGLGARPRQAVLLAEGVPEGRVVEVTRALMDLFDAEGDRANKKRARLKFVVERLGAAEVRRRLHAALAPLPPARPRPVEEHHGGAAAAPALPEGRWFKTNVSPQRQPGRYACAVTVPEGDLGAAELAAVAEAARFFGKGRVRLTTGQNLVVTDVPLGALAEVHAALSAAGLGAPGAGGASDPVSCPGKDVCALAFTRAREASRALRERLAREEALVDSLGRCSLQVSGCPNGCARHAAADVGAQGLVRGAARAPHYRIWTGAVHGAGGRLSRPAPGVVAEAALIDRILDELRRRAGATPA